jgi:hypothetical protein
MGEDFSSLFFLHRSRRSIYALSASNMVRAIDTRCWTSIFTPLTGEFVSAVPLSRETTVYITRDYSRQIHNIFKCSIYFQN